MTDAVEAVIRGNLEAIDQCSAVLRCVSAEQYCAVSSPIISSSMGAHFRHILDIYRSIMLAFSLDLDESVLIDYDKRRRGAACETEQAVAKSEFVALRCWIQSVSDNLLTKTVRVKTEVTLEETEHVRLDSNLLRELTFASSHAVHHLAIISILARLQNICVDTNLGVAPATASYLRSADAS
ncbi:hypothetical protein SAMN02745866_02233 [Alteromonadaceae bacterium Bs31]|nr:hypothetical protein SAMN02745866_02233 [Alteromonadaceae bacterium Bs31]